MLFFELFLVVFVYMCILFLIKNNEHLDLSKTFVTCFTSSVENLLLGLKNVFIAISAFIVCFPVD